MEDFAEGAEEQVVFGDGLLDQLADHGDFRIVDNAMDALGKGLEGVEGFKGAAEQEEGGVAALGHGQLLQELKARVGLHRVDGEDVLDDDDLVVDLVETGLELDARFDEMDFVAHFEQDGLDGRLDRRGADGDQGGQVVRADEIKFFAHVRS